MHKTYWNVTLGIKVIPKPEFIISKDPSLYGYKIDKHGVIAYGETIEQCMNNWKNAYLAETADYDDDTGKVGGLYGDTGYILGVQK